ncbi:MAG: ATP-dependent helicase C-terminal domain-containing protein, partial [Pseudomonadota bacterium]
ALDWPTPPPGGPLVEARALLRRLDALDETGITAYGRALARLPLPPRLGHMLLRAPSAQRALAGRVAVLMTERGLGGTAPDLTQRLAAWDRERSRRAREAEAMAERWVRMAEGALRDDASATTMDGTGPAWQASDRFGALVALAFPERVALKRPVPTSGAPRKDAPGKGAPSRAVPRSDYATLSGRGATIEADAPLARHEGLAIAELTGAGASGRIALAAPLSRQAIETLFAERIGTEVAVAWDDAADAVRARRVRAIESLVLDSAPAPVPPGAGVPVLMERLRAIGAARLPWDAGAARLRARMRLLQEEAGEPDWPDVSDAGLEATLDDWLAPFLPADALRLDAITPALLRDALLSRLDYRQRQRLDAEAPARLRLKAAEIPVDYSAGAPAASARAQAFYGLDAHPVLAGTPVTLTLLSPARRPLQTTRDLPGFWRGSWSGVRAEMRGRYPKHDWPERPWEAKASDRP